MKELSVHFFGMKRCTLLLISLTALFGCKKQEYDVVIRNGIVYDGSGKPGVATDVAINSDTIASIGDLSKAVGKKEIDKKTKRTIGNSIAFKPLYLPIIPAKSITFAHPKIRHQRT